MRFRNGWLLGLALSPWALACGTPAPAPAPVDGGSDAAAPVDANDVDAYRAPRDAGPMFDLGTTARPAQVLLPDAYDGTTALPLIVLIHADGVTGQLQQAYLHIGDAAREAGAYLALPTAGTRNDMGFLVWNDGITQTTPSDDVAYLSSVLDQAQAMLPVDPHRIYFIGHSNGGFMAYRMACVEADRLAGIAVIDAGDYPFDSACTPSRPVSVLHMHGTMDDIVSYDGVVGRYAGAVESTQRWAVRAGCDVAMTHSPAPFDMDSAVAGDETTATDYVAGCAGARVSLFTMSGSGHIPLFTAGAGMTMVDWLLAQSAP